MMHSDAPPVLSPLDAPTVALVRTAAAIAGGSEQVIREQLAAAVGSVPVLWIEELMLQSSLFAGFPRTLNATREWRRHQPLPANAAASVADDTHHRHASTWEVRGEAACAVIYGDMYDRLRQNIAALHPALDQWMIVDGYGKILSRPGLDLARRELCIVAACTATEQDRQLQSHLHGARHAGVPDEAISDAITALDGLVPPAALERARHLWGRIRRPSSPAPAPVPSV
jgi:4-carboxymuconolactone decarboxylase